MKTLTVLGLLAQLLCSTHAQTPIPFAPLDSSMRSLTMLARDFPSIDAVPDAATFGEFQEVRLQQPEAPRARQSSAPANTFPLDKPFVSFPTTPAPDPPRAPPQRNFPPPRGQPPPSRNFPSRQQPSGNFPQPPRQPTRNFPTTPRPQPVTPQPPRNGRPRGVTPVPSISVTPGSSLDIILTSAERRDILDKLLGRDITTIVLTPLQRLAILQENELRQAEARGQPQPPPQRPTKTQRLPPPPKPNTTPRQPPAQTNFQSTFRPQSNFQTSFAPDFGRQENTFVSTTAVPSRQPTTQRPRQPEIPRNFVGGQQISDNSIDVNYDYNDYDNPNPVSSKTMIEQTFSLFENFANRKNGGKGGVSAPVSPFKRPSLRFLPEEQSPRPSLPVQTPRPPPPPPPRAPPPPPPTTRPPPPATTRRPRPRPTPPAQRQRVSRVRIKVPPRSREETPRSFGREEAPRSFGRNSVQTSNTRDRFPIGRLNMDNFLPTTTIAPRTTASPQPPQQQIVRTTTQQPSFPAVSPGQFRPPVREQPSVNHPEALLNMLSPGDQDRFLQQFSSLNTEQQNYAFRQFLNSRKEIQRFAISQFLKLDPETLIVSIQAEIDRERGERASSPARSPPPQPQQSLQQQLLQFNSINKRENEDELSSSLSAGKRPRQAELEHFRIAKQLQRQQREQLEEIIRQQNRINIQLQGQTVFV